MENLAFMPLAESIKQIWRLKNIFFLSHCKFNRHARNKFSNSLSTKNKVRSLKANMPRAIKDICNALSRKIIIDEVVASNCSSIVKIKKSAFHQNQHNEWKIH